jgi:hypothetical protein
VNSRTAYCPTKVSASTGFNTGGCGWRRASSRREGGSRSSENSVVGVRDPGVEVEMVFRAKVGVEFAVPLR